MFNVFIKDICSFLTVIVIFTIMLMTTAFRIQVIHMKPFEICWQMTLMSLWTGSNNILWRQIPKNNPICFYSHRIIAKVSWGFFFVPDVKWLSSYLISYYLILPYLTLPTTLPFLPYLISTHIEICVAHTKSVISTTLSFFFSLSCSSWGRTAWPTTAVLGGWRQARGQRRKWSACWTCGIDITPGKDLRKRESFRRFLLPGICAGHYHINRGTILCDQCTYY